VGCSYYVRFWGKKVLKDVERSDMDVYSSSDNAWTSALALKWITDVLKPQTEKFNRSLRIWDLFSAHKDEAVRSRLVEINVDVLYVPARLTYCLQPLDVYVNRSLKDTIRVEWDNFMKDPANLKTKGKIKKTNESHRCQMDN